MASVVSSAGAGDRTPDRFNNSNEAFSSGVSWGAVIGGAFAASASYLILLALGAGFGLSTVSPWSTAGAFSSPLETGAIVWLILIEILASALGGYIAGRLRTKWTMIHTDEVYFRDTASGFLAWSVALVISVTFLASAAVSMVGGGVAHNRMLGENAATTASTVNTHGYFVDKLFRSNNGSGSRDTSAQTEAELILANALRHNQISAEDQHYLAQLIAAKTGASSPDAEKRVSEVLADARQVEDAVRKETARLLLWLFLSFLMGAFSASYAATIGGRQRDHVKAV
jgi:hypothetical protein